MKRCVALCLSLALSLGILSGCAQPAASSAAQSQATASSTAASAPAEDLLGNGWAVESSMELQYATQFSVDYFEGGYKLLSLSNGDRFLVVPEGASLPEGIDPDIVPLYQPLDNLYLAASSAMSLFDSLGHADKIRLSSTKETSWYIDSAKQAMADGQMVYVGAYNEPDYEMLVNAGCPLAVESRMIDEASEVKSKLEELGIAVLTDQSSLEKHPLGRSEWIRFYAALFNEEEKAAELFQQQVDFLNEVASAEATGKTVAFFYISPSSGSVVVRKGSDYISKMLELAGGDYLFSDMDDGDPESSTEPMEMEAFFAAAKDADYLIYNTSVGGDLATTADLIEQNQLLAEFKAVQEGNVWCTKRNLYQVTTELGQMIQSFHEIFTGEADETGDLPYLYRLP